MKAAVVTSYSAPPAYSDFEEPQPQPGEKLLHVTAAGLHPIVRSIANGSHYTATGKFPFIAGVDGVGRDADGNRFYFGANRPPFGTFAQQTIASPYICLPLPDGVDDVTVAGTCNPAMSGWAALDRAGFVAGESVLILGATGSAGRMATQIARRRGARHVTVAGRNPAMLEQLSRLGADRVISLEQPKDSLLTSLRGARQELGFDVVLDYVWGAPAEAVITVIGQKIAGKPPSRIRYVQIGNSAGADITMPAAPLRSADLHILGSGFGSASFESLAVAVRQFLYEAAKAPFVFATRVVPLANIGSVWSEKDDAARVVFTL